ncbi:regulator of cell autolysis [Pedobacter sp. HMWF019]|uniref:histidine kinase n=1 Tax=Pedobacter sp. HMWF019 TaxID=2056856 RepID=UPI000D384FA5|nr:histidine kinase [Pedobacter sp. HMWF019]PTT02063.1 regulator of cell autolysis [Pedobacter sp. HMWF019]
MKQILRLSLFGVMISWTMACHKKPLPSLQNNLISEKIRKLENVAVSPGNSDSVVSEWRKLDEHPLVKKDAVLSANVKYNLARLYGMRGQDSARFFVEKALELIESTGNQKYKALIYNGVGNVRSMEAKQREASYYYNKAAAIVLSDATTGLSPEARSVILLSAAQSNRTFFQYHLAEKMNRAALPLIDSLPQGHISRQRALVQMIQILNLQQKPADSMAPYLRRLEVLQALHPDKYNISYLYESKMKYFDAEKQNDSLLHYQLLKTEVDEVTYDTGPSSVNINNLLVDYCNVATIYVALKQPPKAAQFIDKAKKLKEQHPSLILDDDEVVYQKSLAELYSLQGRNKDATGVLKNVVRLQENLYQATHTQALAEMNALYQLQVKDRSIRALNESIKIKQLQLQQNRLWLVVAVLSVVLLGVTLLFLYYNFRQRRARQEKEKVLLHQQLLRTQMEPHFIFNTLSAVQSFVRLDKKEKAIKYLNRFSRLLRNSLELSRESLVPLDEEIDTLENYLCLQQMRFEEAFTYHIRKPDVQDLGAVMLPPMLIQPYVENAILHGIELESGGGNIDVCFELEEDVLRVTVTDTGNAEGYRSDTTHRSLSGAISRERMDLLGKKAGVFFTRGSNGGTIVILQIPVVFG